MLKLRVSIPPDVAAKALFACDYTCCVCRERDRSVQIHHIDEDPSNNHEKNLAVLCLLCHNETQVKGGFGRKLDAKLVTEYRDDWLRRVQSRRDKADELASSTSIVSCELKADSLSNVLVSHALIPTLYGVPYDTARERLIAAGWQPYMHHWSRGASPDVCSGNGPIFWNRGYHELSSSSGTGYAFCRFEFVDVFGNRLAVITAGEEEPNLPSQACVIRWFFDRDDLGPEPSQASTVSV